MEPRRSGRLSGKLLELRQDHVGIRRNTHTRQSSYNGGLQGSLSDASTDGQLTVTDMVIEVLTDVDAIVFGHWMLAVDNKAQKGVFTVQLRKIEGDWLFVSDHSSTSE